MSLKRRTVCASLGKLCIGSSPMWLFVISSPFGSLTDRGFVSVRMFATSLVLTVPQWLSHPESIMFATGGPAIGSGLIALLNLVLVVLQLVAGSRLLQPLSPLLGLLASVAAAFAAFGLFSLLLFWLLGGVGRGTHS